MYIGLPAQLMVALVVLNVPQVNDSEKAWAAPEIYKIPETKQLLILGFKMASSVLKSVKGMVKVNFLISRR